MNDLRRSAKLSRDAMGRGDRTQDSYQAPNTVWVHNNTGEDREQFEILKLNGPAIEPEFEQQFRRRVVFQGIAPTANCQFVVLLKPAVQGAVVPALLSGVVQTQITKTSTSPAAPFSLAVVAGQYKLKQSSAGLAGRALWAESGSGVKWAYVEIGVPATKPLVAYLNEDLLAGDSASAHLYEGNPGALTLSSEAVTVWDGIMDPGDYMAAGTKVWVEVSYSGELFVLVPYCSPTGTAPPPIVTDPPEDQEPPPTPPDWNFPFFVEEYSGTPPFTSSSGDDLTVGIYVPPIEP